MKTGPWGRRIRRLACICAFLFLISGCSARQAESETAVDSAPACILAQVTSGHDEVLANGRENAVLFDEMLRSGKCQNADLNFSKAYTVRLQYEDGSKDAYLMLPDPVSETVWFVADGCTYRASRKYAEQVLALDFLAPLYLEPLSYGLEVSTPYDRYSISVSSYRFEYLMPAGWKTVSSPQKASYPTLSAVNKDDISIRFEQKPDSYTVTFTDDSGNTVRELQKGAYHCEVCAEYTESTMARYSGSVTFRFDISLTGKPEIILSSGNVQKGGVLGIFIKNLMPEDQYILQSTVLPSPVMYPSGAGYVSLIGIPSASASGKQTVTLLRNPAGTGSFSAVSEARFSVENTKFEKQELTVGSGLSSINTADNAKHDRALTYEAKASSLPAQLWDGVFLRPAEGGITTDFGQARYVNGVFSSRHSGIDIAAPEGASVKAAAAGRVVFAGELILSGNTVIIDHGLNVFSGYSHLSSIGVTAGDDVKAGFEIGKVGSTGFSTGPHLHYTVSIGSVYVNPLSFETDDPLGFVGELTENRNGDD